MIERQKDRLKSDQLPFVMAVPAPFREPETVPAKQAPVRATATWSTAPVNSTTRPLSMPDYPSAPAKSRVIMTLSLKGSSNSPAPDGYPTAESSRDQRQRRVAAGLEGLRPGRSDSLDQHFRLCSNDKRHATQKKARSTDPQGDDGCNMLVRNRTLARAISSDGTNR